MWPPLWNTFVPPLDVSPSAKACYAANPAMLARESGACAGQESLRTNLLTEAAVDVLSEVLSVVRLTGAVYFDVQAKAPWVAETPPASRIGADVMPDFELVISFHV